MAAGDRIVLFGGFELDLASGELRKDGIRVPLQQQPFKLLAVLVERPGEVVTREELRRELWADGTYVSFERGLTSAMRKVREALGERANAPEYIQTLQGRGYRFIAPVTRPTAHTSPALDAWPPPIPLPGMRRRTRPFWGVALAATLVLGLLTSRSSAPPARGDEKVAAAQALSDYACELKSKGKFREALQVIRQAHALAPQSAKIAAEVGFYSHAAGHYEDEFPMLRHAISIDGNSADAWFHLGLAHARRNNFDEAIESLERARGLAADNSSIDHWLNWARDQQRSVRGS